VFVAYAIAGGLLLGRLAGGRLEGLAELRIRFAWLGIAGFVIQLLLFNGPLGEVAGGAVPAIYVGSTVLVLGVVVANARVPGVALMAVGAASNLAAIVANGGYMPSDPAAEAAAGLGEIGAVSNSIVIADPALRPLTDIFAIPAGLPFANVFSVGDVLIGIGAVWAIVAAMRRAAPAEATAGEAG
jgi:hypothetical protein